MVEHNGERVLEQWVREYENDPEFIAEGLAADVIDETLGILNERALTQSWLAQQMGVSRAHISNLFNAPPNLTLLSIARLAVALDVKPKVFLNSENLFIQPLNAPLDYEDLMTNKALFAERRTSNAQDIYPSSNVGAPRYAVA